MSNWAFLSCTPDRRTYPSYGGKPRSQNHAVLSAPNYLPVLWWAFFRPDDLVLDRHAREAMEGDEVPAPIVSRSLAKGRLAEALPRVEKLFPKGGSLARHADLLGEALTRAPAKGKYLTLEHVEIAAYYQPGEFQQVQSAILAHMAGRKVAGLDTVLRHIAVPSRSRRFVLPDEVTKEKFSKSNQQDLYGLLGGGAREPAPWDWLKPKEPVLAPSKRDQRALVESVRTGNLKQARMMLQRGASPHARSEDGFSPLEDAVMGKSDQMVRLLLEAGARPLARAVCIAADNGSAGALKLLLDAGGDPQSFAKSILPPMNFALSHAGTSYRQRMPKVRLLLDRGANVNARNEHGEACLICCYENNDAVRLMLPSASQAVRRQLLKLLHVEIPEVERIGLPRLVRRLKQCLQSVENYVKA